MNRQSDDGLGLGSDGFVVVAGREQQCPASRNEKTSPERWADDGGQEGARKRLRVKTGKFHDVHKAGDGPAIEMGEASEDTVCLAACFGKCANARFGMPVT